MKAAGTEILRGHQTWNRSHKTKDPWGRQYCVSQDTTAEPGEGIGMDPLRVGHCNAPVWTDQPRQSEDQHGKRLARQLRW